MTRSRTRPALAGLAALTLAALSLAALFAVVLPAGALHAQDARTGSQDILAATEWVQPPEEIADAVLAPRYLNVSLNQPSPNGMWFLHQLSDGPVTMDRFSRPFDELGGQFYEPQANRSRSLSIRNMAGLQVISAADGSVTDIEVPDGARVSGAQWSPDGSQLAFYVHTDDATHIHVADPASGDSRQITRDAVLATMVTTFEWTSNGDEIATVLIPDGRAARPMAPSVPSGPQVKQTEDGRNILRTYASLMATPHDEALLEWHVTGQLATIAVDNRRVANIGDPAMIRSFDFSPDGMYARVTTMQQPFSYIVPVTSFGRVEEIWDRDGTVLAEIDETELNTGIRGAPSAPGVAGDEEEPDRRQMAWREDGAGLVYLRMEPAPEEEEGAEEEEAEEEEDGDARRMDRVMLWAPPFGEDDETVLYESRQRMANHRYSEDYGWLFVTQGGGGGARGGFGGGGARGTRTEYAVRLDDPETRYEISEWDTDEFYENPGSLLMTSGQAGGGGAAFRFGGGGGGAGGHFVEIAGAEGAESVFLMGTVYNEDPLAESPMSFLDRVALRSGDRERVYESSNDGQSERITTVLDADAGRFVVQRETPTEVAQGYLVVGSARTQLTSNVDYTPDLTNAPRQRFTVERPDGFRFLVNVTLPPDYQEGERRPAMFWFYPREYEDQEGYDEGARSYNKNAFPNFGTRSIEYLIRLGYVVVEPDAPIVGEEGRINNNYQHDLRNNLAAVIDELDARGLIDRRRLGLGGHSYGAFGTLNAMVHTPFFKAGIAGDGNYNRTFTPLGFQREPRYFWDAREVYLGMSPFVYANNLTGAVLLYHGMHDQNVGTAPDHSPRLFHALNGLGKEAAMYLYPFEDHGPATRETLLDLWARWAAWLDVHLAAEERPVT
ncbi:MAG: prolyl oligopeptidase family serine peptidase [Gemmatimonadota bacterium]|nr:prolyl oligopeptidase family serine peptidase [Gemmatimonadota bacterium]MDE2866743.1 prolyl oligopeptidase family serine peptidase [Gemmatimonadota bacterium]